MKKLMILAVVVTALASCQSSSKKNAEILSMPPVVEEVEEVYTGTLPAADGPGINYVLTLDVATNGVDTLYTLDVTYLDADGPGKNKTFRSKGKQQKIQKLVNNRPKKAVKLTPSNGEQPMYFLVVNDTTLRLVNDSTLVETVGQAVYDITKVKK